MKKQIKLSPKRVKILSDTIINKINCIHIEFLLQDSENARLSYNICLNKRTGLPVYTKRFNKGILGKGDVTTSEIVTFINENNYSNYSINPNIFSKITDFKIPADYSTAKEISPLKAGDKIPVWKLQDLQGKTVSNKDFEGYLVLMDFSYNECAACALSIPSLKLLNERYKNSPVKIISVNTYNDKESVVNFVKKNNINYTTLINGKTVAKDFHVSAYPTFYLIDQKGNIISMIDGYSNDFEKNMILQIDKFK